MNRKTSNAVQGEKTDPGYLPLPEISPYIHKGATKYKSNSYENPKEDFKFYFKQLEKLRDLSTPGTLLDVGCANGEFLYYVKERTRDWKLHGRDTTPEFIQTASGFAGLAEVDFRVENLFDISERFDVVTCFGTSQIFPDVERFLEKLITCACSGGLLLIDGMFNPFKCEVKIQFQDNSTPTGRGLWRSDFNITSQERISNYLSGRVRSHVFKKVPLNIDIPIHPDVPHANGFTLKLDDGSRICTNGMRIIYDRYLLIIETP